MKEQNSVTQSNYLIRGRRGGGITLREQKLLYLAISMIEPNAQELSEFRIRVRDLYELLGLGKKTPAKDLKETADKLVSRRIELPTNGEDEFDFINIVSRCSYVENEGEVIIRINKDIEPFLIKLRGNFTSYKLYNILKLKSEYSVALFQFFKSYVFQGEVTITLSDLKDFLFFDQSKYPQYAYFKRDVLKKCINEINSKTDLQIQFKELKQGRSVYALKFSIQEYKSNTIESVPSDVKIRGEKSLQLDKVLELFQSYGMELSALDGYNYLDKAKRVWGPDNALKELLNLIEFTLKDKSIKEPLKFLYYRLNGYELNIKKGLMFNHGFGASSNKYVKEVIPSYLLKRAATEPTILSEEEQAFFESERKRILDILKK